MPSTTDDKSQIGRRAVVGTAWATFERVGSLALQFVVNLVLARLLLPADFGYIALLAIFMAVSRVMIDGGMVSALIQKKDVTNTDYSVIFIWNTSLSVLFYTILYFTAPLIADFYNLPLLQSVIRVYGLSLIFAALSQVQVARLRRQLRFKLMAAVNLGSYAAAGVLAIALAANGMGVWALVAMEMGFTLFMALLYNLMSRWRPTLSLSGTSFKQLFSFGGYLLGANLLQEVAKNVQGMIIGYRFSDTQAGLYSQAHKLDQINSYAIPQALVQVLFPVYSHLQDSAQQLIQLLSQSIRAIAFVIFPLLTLLIIISDPLVVTLWGDNWLACAPYFRILTVGGLFVSLQNVNFYAVAAKGHSRLLFKWSFYKWGVLLAMMLLAMHISIDAILWAMALSNANIYFVNAWLCHRHVGLRLSSQLAMLVPVILVSTATAAITLGVSQALPLSALSPWRIIIESAAFITIYLLLSHMFRLRAWSDMAAIIKKIRR